jgi:hypothetical protein
VGDIKLPEAPKVDSGETATQSGREVIGKPFQHERGGISHPVHSVILSILSSCPNVRVFRVFRLPVSPSAPQAPRPVPRAFFLPQAGVQPISQKKDALLCFIPIDKRQIVIDSEFRITHERIRINLM